MTEVMIPGDNWYATFKEDDKQIHRRVIAWVRDQDWQSPVRGLVQIAPKVIVYADEDLGFVGYRHASMSTSDL